MSRPTTRQKLARCVRRLYPSRAAIDDLTALLAEPDDAAVSFEMWGKLREARDLAMALDGVLVATRLATDD